MSKSIIAIIVIIVVIVLGYLIYQSVQPEEPSIQEQACLDSGGTVEAAMCCEATEDFPNTCLIGACGCAPDNSHEVKVCDCGDALCFDGAACIAIVANFSECVTAGYPVMESMPQQCATPDGRIFTEGEEHCVAQEGATMSLFEAMQAATMEDSECAEQLKQPYYDFSMCNADTGTWWIDLEPEEPKEGCNPACVIDIETSETEINWRCTGLIEP